MIDKWKKMVTIEGAVKLEWIGAGAMNVALRSGKERLCR